MRVGRRHAQGGSALVICLIMGALIGFMVMAYVSMVNNQNRQVMRSHSWNYAIAVAEAGIEEALTHLYYHPNNLEADGWTLANNAYVKTRTIGNVALPEGYYRVAISNVNPPVIYSEGRALIPNSTNYIPARTVRVTTMKNGLFRKGMVAKGTVDMSGNNIKTDSFDSENPLYSTNGRYDPNKTKDNGDVATNTSVVNSFKLGNANIYGHAATGPGGNVSVGSNGAVGSKAWQAAGGKGIQPGWFTDDMNVSFPEVQAPFTTGQTPGSGKVNGTNYAYVLGSGNYVLPGFSLSGKNAMLVNGNAVLYVTGDIGMAGQSFIYIATNCSLNLYMAGGSADFAGNGLANANANATNFFFWGLPSNTSISLRGNAAFTGVIYAPDADFTLGGGGNNEYDFVGASVTGSVRLNGHFNFHYDEMLSRLGANAGYVITGWNEI